MRGVGCLLEGGRALAGLLALDGAVATAVVEVLQVVQDVVRGVDGRGGDDDHAAGLVAGVSGECAVGEDQGLQETGALVEGLGAAGAGQIDAREAVQGVVAMGGGAATPTLGLGRGEQAVVGVSGGGDRMQDLADSGGRPRRHGEGTAHAPPSAAARHSLPRHRRSGRSRRRARGSPRPRGSRHS